jgi:phosphopantetheine--protein transferase-like protein
MRFEKRQIEFLFGRLTAKTLLTAEGLPNSGEPYRSLAILNEPDGAPFLEKGRGSLSISHREDFASSAYYPGVDRQIGIDLEVIEKREWSFVEDFFTPAEVGSARDLTEPDQSVWVTLMWSAKEAVLKAWRKGLRLDTRTIEIKLITDFDSEAWNKDWVLMQVKVRDDQFPACWLFGRVFNGYVLTMAYTKIASNEVAPPLLPFRVYGNDQNGLGL